MPSTHASLYCHCVFSTKNREPWLGPAVRTTLHEYLGGILRGLGAHSHGIGGIADHVHVAASLKTTHRVSDVMREVKSESSKWLRREHGMAGFAWQEGFGVFSFGARDLDKVVAYIAHQPEHHRVRTFQEEYVAMLERGMVVYDANYLW